MLEDYDNCVRINGRLIPAVNIQVENVPGFLEMHIGPPMWFGVYFEIMFENGGLWVVSMGSDENDKNGLITIEYFDRWATKFAKYEMIEKGFVPDFTQNVSDWDVFLKIYDEELRNGMFGCNLNPVLAEV